MGLSTHMVIRMAVHDKLAQLVMDSCQAFVDGLRGDQQQVGNALKCHRIIVEAQIRASNTKVRARRMVKKGMSSENPITE